jgi:hypothetical protein
VANLKYFPIGVFFSGMGEATMLERNYTISMFLILKQTFRNYFRVIASTFYTINRFGAVWPEISPDIFAGLMISQFIGTLSKMVVQQ